MADSSPLIPGGFFLVSRGIVGSSLWALRSDDFKMAVYMLAIANHSPKKWCDQQGRERVIGRGEFVRSLTQMSEKSGLTRKVVRTSVRNLSTHGFVEIVEKRANAYCHYRIPKYEHYQTIANYMGGVVEPDGPTVGQHTANTRPTTAHQQELENYKEVEKEGSAPPASTPKASPGSGGFGAVLAHLVNVAEAVTLCPNRAETVERYLRALLARGIPAPKIEEALCRPDVRGRSILEIQDLLVPRDGSGGSVSSLDEIKRICAKLDAEGR